VIGVVTLVFLILHLTPGDPVRQMLPPDASEEDVIRMREYLGLDDPLPVQYFRYWGRVIHGDFGRSLRSQRPVLKEILARLPYTIELAIVAVILSNVIGIPIGVISAIKQDTVFDNVSRAIAFLGVSLPSFWLATMFILLFALVLGWFPPSGRAGPLWTLAGLRSIFMPALTLAVGSAAGLARLARSSMLEVLRQDYITVARAKGLRERLVYTRHALRNALLPVMTFMGTQFGYLLGGAVISETVFAWPGMGQLAVHAIFFRDYPLIQGIVFFYAIGVMLVNLAVDLTYMLVDPRISLS
jgi:ABC-type dipeptide/oligopeptide/nickel transport system permease component